MEELISLIQQVANQSKKLKEELILKEQKIAQLNAELNETIALKIEFEAKLTQLTEQLKHENATNEKVDQTENLQEQVEELVKEIDACILHLRE